MIVQFEDGPADGDIMVIFDEPVEPFIAFHATLNDDGPVTRSFYRAAVDGTTTFIRSDVR